MSQHILKFLGSSIGHLCKCPKCGNIVKISSTVSHSYITPESCSRRNNSGSLNHVFWNSQAGSKIISCSAWDISNRYIGSMLLIQPDNSPNSFIQRTIPAAACDNVKLSAICENIFISVLRCPGRIHCNLQTIL